MRSYTYAEVRFSEGLPDRIGAHITSLAFLGGVPKAIVCDNLKARVTTASRYEPGVIRTCQDLAAQLRREGFAIARCTVERLTAGLGVQGVIRAKPVRTTISDKAASCPLDHVNQQFHAPRPNALGSDFTYVVTWTDFVYVAFLIDAYARRIVGWRVSRTAQAGFALYARSRPFMIGGPPIAAGSSTTATAAAQSVAIKYTERLAQAGVEPPVGSVGDSYDNALAEKINGLYNAAVIHRRGPWRSLQLSRLNQHPPVAPRACGAVRRRK